MCSVFFCFKQNTAYEMRISDWSSDVCSSDLLVAPGPDAAQLDRILTIAARTPDHGKLAPWRFVVVPEDRRDAFAALLHDAYLAERPEAKRSELEAVEQFARQAPTLVVARAEEHTSELQSLMRISYAVFCWKKQN